MNNPAASSDVPAGRRMNGSEMLKRQERESWSDGVLECWFSGASHTKKSETRDPKTQRRPRSEDRDPKKPGEGVLGPSVRSTGFLEFSGFALRPSFGLRISDFGFRLILDFPP